MNKTSKNRRYAELIDQRDLWLNTLLLQGMSGSKRCAVLVMEIFIWGNIIAFECDLRDRSNPAGT